MAPHRRRPHDVGVSPAPDPPAVVARTRYWLAAASVGAAAMLVLVGSRKLGPDHLQIAEGARCWILLAVAVLAGMVACLARAVVWREALVEGGGMRRAPPFGDIAGPALAGAALNAVLGIRLGEPARARLVRRRLACAGVRPSDGALAGAAMAEHLATAAAWVACCAALAIAFPPPAWAWAAVVPVMVGCALVPAAAALARSRRGLAVADRAARAGGAGRWAGRAAHALVAGGAALGHVRWPRLVAVAVFGWTAQMAAIVAVLGALGLTHLGPSVPVTLLLTTACAGMFVAPGNVVVFQAGVILPLALAYDVPVATAVATGAVLQITRIAGAVGAGSATLLRERSRARGPAAARPPLAWRMPLLYDVGLRVAPGSRILRAREEAAVLDALDTVARPHHEVLEIGAGTGWYTAAVATRVRGVCALEPAPAMRARLRRKLARRGHANVTVHDGGLPLDSAGDPSVDGVACIGVLDYLDDLTPGLASIARRLAPGGWLVCTAPARDVRAPARRRRMPHQARSYGKDVAELSARAAEAGLEVTATSTITLRGRPRTIVATMRRAR